MQRGLTMPSVGKYCCKNEIKTELDCAQSSRKRQRTEGTTEEVDGRSQPQDVPEVKVEQDSKALGLPTQQETQPAGVTSIVLKSEAMLTTQPGDQLQGPAVLSLDDSNVDSPALSSQQAEILDLVMEGKNVFFTGNVGTGKSFLLQRIIAELRTSYGQSFHDSVAICAPTGIAAAHVGGTTIHSAFGIGVPKTVSDFERAENHSQRICAWKVLLIDGVSMVSGEMFENLERISREIRESKQPFGGLQLVLCGDFFELPPITKKVYHKVEQNAFLNRGYTFEAPAWKRAGIEQRLLTHVFRERDERFVRILDAIRYSSKDLHSALAELLDTCERPLEVRDGIVPTTLFSTNREVDNMNDSHLANLPDKLVYLASKDRTEAFNSAGKSGRCSRATFEVESSGFFRGCMAPLGLSLKVGAQVMLLQNIDMQAEQRLVNGSRGVVIGWASPEEARAAMAAELGGTYYGDTIRQVWKDQMLPRVRFTNGRERLVLPTTFSTEIMGLGRCFRVQIPLKLAWAMTIHKAQVMIPGMSMDHLRVSLANIWAEGQAYVALSRARSLEGLEIIDFQRDCVKASHFVQTSRDVKKFHDCLVKGIEYSNGGSWQRLMQITSPVSQPAPREGCRPGSCFNCGQPGHWSFECPYDAPYDDYDDDDWEDPGYYDGYEGGTSDESEDSDAEY